MEYIIYLLCFVIATLGLKCYEQSKQIKRYEDYIRTHKYFKNHKLNNK